MPPPLIPMPQVLLVHDNSFHLLGTPPHVYRIHKEHIPLPVYHHLGGHGYSLLLEFCSCVSSIGSINCGWNNDFVVFGLRERTFFPLSQYIFPVALCAANR